MNYQKELANGFDFIYQTHLDQKKMLTQEEAIALLSSGFKDCSYGNDECPSYGIVFPSDVELDCLVLMFHPNLWDGEPQARFSVFVYAVGDHYQEFNRVEEAIAYYQQTYKKLLSSLEEGKE